MEKSLIYDSMQYETMKSNQIDFTFESKNFSSIFGLYLFSLGAVFSGYSLYLLLEATESIERKIITWSGQGLFWSLILFFKALFILFIPVEFLNVFKIYNSTYKDLIFNISKKKIKIHQVNSEVIYDNETSSLNVFKSIIPFLFYHFQNFLTQSKSVLSN